MVLPSAYAPVVLPTAEPTQAYAPVALPSAHAPVALPTGSGSGSGNATAPAPAPTAKPTDVFEGGAGRASVAGGALAAVLGAIAMLL